MGLELIHFKAVMEKPANKGLTISYQTEERFNGFNVPFDHFYKYIQEIDVPRLIDTVIIVQNEDDLEYAIKRLINSSHEILVRKNDEQLAEDIKSYERMNGLGACLKSYDTEPVTWTILEYYEEQKQKGFYAEEIGWQTNGVTDAFWTRFADDELSSFALKEDFDFAYSCVNPFLDETGNEYRQKNFKEHFIDKFIEGASYIWLGM